MLPVSINLHEAIDNDVTLWVRKWFEECGAHDTVVIKDKLRDRKNVSMTTTSRTRAITN